MPVTKSAKKALRQSRQRAATNKLVRQRLKKVVAKTKRSQSVKELAEIYRTLDRATQKGIIHKNKAARLKSRLAKLAQITPRPTVKKRAKK